MTTMRIDSGKGARQVDLSSYLDADVEERAHEEEYAWIKALRHARVDGMPLRARFTCRGDSLWWFAELFLHKERVVLEIMRTIAALDALVERERPLAIAPPPGRRGAIVTVVARARGIRVHAARARVPRLTIARMDVRGTALGAAALLSRVRRRPPPATSGGIAAFVHRAFWRADAANGGAESYIGPVLQELEARSSREAVHYVGIGPRRNFRARRWWHALRRERASRLVAIERYAPLPALAASRAIWRDRHRIRRALCGSADIRAHAVIRGCDCWALIEPQLAGIALLQFPWSARAMDEAAAALDTLAPEAAVTYAEAGGWGRAIALEARRRRIPVAALQHGFIYRHWLNYRHEPDEMQPDASNAADRGFPRPDLTLLYDEYAARHLRTAGHFPADALAVAGSAGRDALVSSVRAMPQSRIEEMRQRAGADRDQPLVVLATKEREASRVLPDLIAAIRAIPAARLAIKPHPAETAGVYAGAVGDAANVTILPPSTPLADLLAGAAAIVTVNSTVAIDALALGIPSLVIGLPNNLSPFVESGVMAGARSREEIRTALERVLYDQEFRRQLGEAAGRVAAEFGREGSESTAEPAGGAAARGAAAVLALARSRAPR